MGEIAPRADGESAQSNRSHANASQGLHGMAQVGEHPANLTVATLAKFHRQERARGITPQDLEMRFSGARSWRGFVWKKDSLFESRDIGGLESTLHQHFVFLMHLVPRMREPIRQFAIVGEQEQSARVHVEAAHGIEPRLTGMFDECRREAASLRIRIRADESRWLVQHHIDVSLRRSKWSPVNVDFVLERIDPRRQRVDDFAIHLDESLCNHDLGSAPRGDSCIREHLLDADAARGVGVGMRRFSRASRHLHKVAVFAATMLCE